MKVFISGASGLLGGNCLRYFKSQDWEVTGSHFSYPTPDTVYFNTLDSHDPENFDILSFRPDVIVHCGALTHVDYCESHPEESYEKTVKSTLNLISLAKASGAAFVFISTDYVFDGVNGPYTEDAPLNPLCIYGLHKMQAEQYALNKIENTLVLRITNVYGDEERGKNFVSRIIDQCKKGVKLTLKLPYDQFASPTNAWDIARALFLLLRDGKKGIYHISGSDYMNRVELALRVISYFPGTGFDLQPVSTAELNQPAQRPLIGGFVKRKFSTEYPDFLFGTVDSYLQEVVSKGKGD